MAFRGAPQPLGTLLLALDHTNPKTRSKDHKRQREVDRRKRDGQIKCWRMVRYLHGHADNGRGSVT